MILLTQVIRVIVLNPRLSSGREDSPQTFPVQILGESSTAYRRWLQITAQSRIGPPCGGLAARTHAHSNRPLPIATPQPPSSSPSGVTNTKDNPGMNAPQSPCRLKAWDFLIPYRGL